MNAHKKLLGLLVLVIAFASVLGIVTLADRNTSPALTVEAYNLSFEDSVYLVYAVSSKNVSADQVQMLFWTTPKAGTNSYVKGTESYSTKSTDTVTYEGKDCKVFKYDKLRAKNMTDNVYARAYIEIDGQAYYSPVVKYSVLQYAYNKLGITGTATQDQTLKSMLNEMLEYGAQAQIYADYHTERLATDTFFRLTVTNGTLSDGFTQGLYTAGEQAALTASAMNGNGGAFIGWEKNGHTVSLDATCKLTMTGDHTTVSACYGTPYTPVVRFAVTSDIHWRSATKEDPLRSKDNTELLFETAYDYSSSQSYNDLDGIFVAGDYTQNGSEAEMDEFYDTVNRLTKGDTIVRTVLGNHEYWTSGAKYRGEEGGTRYGPQSIVETYERHLKYGEYEEVDQHLVINGYHFILLSMDRYNDGYLDENGKLVKPASNTNFYSDEKLAWLEAEIKKAVADDPSGTKPIFIFHHVRAANSGINNNNNTSNTGDTDLAPILNRYPQVVDFSGHTHCSLTDPRTIAQTGYTAINTGSLAYLRATLINYKNGKYYTEASTGMDNQGSWDTGDIEKATRNACLYFIVEVDANNVIRLVINNIYTGEIEDVIMLGKVGDPANFSYTEARLANADVPKFTSHAKVEVDLVTKKSVQLIIPQAECPDGMNSYRVEIYKDDTLITTVYRLACQYLGGAMPETIVAPITGLDSSTVYTAKIYPVSYWGIEGKPLVTQFITRSTMDMIGIVNTPDIFSLGLNSDSTAINTVDGTALGITGNPIVTYDSTLKRNVVSLDGNSAYRYLDISNYYTAIGASFTFETYFCVDSIPSTYVDIVSNQQSGGFGLELKSGGSLQFIITLGGSSTARPSVHISTGEWVHIVVTYDGTTLSMYKDGILVSTATPNKGDMKQPAENARYLVIGGDSNAGTSGDCFMTGKIAVANIYADSFTPGEVSALYNMY